MSQHVSDLQQVASFGEHQAREAVPGTVQSRPSYFERLNLPFLGHGQLAEPDLCARGLPDPPPPVAPAVVLPRAARSRLNAVVARTRPSLRAA